MVIISCARASAFVHVAGINFMDIAAEGQQLPPPGGNPEQQRGSSTAKQRGSAVLRLQLQARGLVEACSRAQPPLPAHVVGAARRRAPGAAVAAANAHLRALKDHRQEKSRRCAAVVRQRKPGVLQLGSNHSIAAARQQRVLHLQGRGVMCSAACRRAWQAASRMQHPDLP